MVIMLALWSRFADGRNGAQVPTSSTRSRVMSFSRCTKSARIPPSIETKRDRDGDANQIAMGFGTVARVIGVCRTFLCLPRARPDCLRVVSVFSARFLGVFGCAVFRLRGFSAARFDERAVRAARTRVIASEARAEIAIHILRASRAASAWSITILAKVNRDH
jgi:hypothetical protein